MDLVEAFVWYSRHVECYEPDFLLYVNKFLNDQVLALESRLFHMMILAVMSAFPENVYLGDTQLLENVFTVSQKRNSQR
jgi:hypothetical protein